MFCISSWSQIWRILRIINFPLDCSKLPSTTNVSKYLATFFKRHAKYWKQCLRGHLNISSCQKHKFMVNTIEYNQLRHQRLHQRDKISGLSSFPQSKFCRRKFVRTHQTIPPKMQTLNTFSQSQAIPRHIRIQSWHLRWECAGHQPRMSEVLRCHPDDRLSR